MYISEELAQRQIHTATHSVSGKQYRRIHIILGSAKGEHVGYIYIYIRIHTYIYIYTYIHIL